MILPPVATHAIELFEKGFTPTKITRRNIKIRTFTTESASARTLRRWHSYWETGEADPVEYRPEKQQDEDNKRPIVFKEGAPTPEELQQALEVWQTLDEIKDERHAQRLLFQLRHNPKQLPSDSHEKLAKYKEFDPENVRRIVSLVDEVYEFMDRVDPVIVDYDRTFDTDFPIAIMFTSCFHFYGRYSFDKQSRKALQYLTELPRVYMMQLGDEVDGFLPRFYHTQTVNEQVFSARLQVELFKQESKAAMFARGEDDPTVLAAFKGQHGGSWFEKSDGDNPLKKWYLDNHVPYFDGLGYITLYVGDQTYRIAGSHQLPGTSMYNPTHPHYRAFWQKFPSADIIFMGDKHQTCYQERQVYEYEARLGLRKSPYVHLIQTGTAKSGLDKYTIQRWTPGQSEWYIALFSPLTHHILVTRDMILVEQYVTGAISFDNFNWQEVATD
jgi:hypothetical protein